MLSLLLRVNNPWHNEDRWPWRDLYQRAWPLTRNKTFEIGVFFYPYTLFELDIHIEWRGHDHAGPRLCMTLLGLEIQLCLVDNRHWDPDLHDWVQHG